MRNNDMRAFIEEWLSRQGTDENYMVAKARAALAAPVPVAHGITDDDIRRVFLANGFTVKEGQTDLKPYVFAAARALLALAAPAPVAQSLTGEQINDEAWRVEAVKEYEPYTGSPRLKVEGLHDFAHAIAAKLHASTAPAPVAQSLTDAQIIAAARALNKLSADACGVDEADSWKLYGNSYIADAAVILKAAHGIQTTGQEGGAA